MKKFAICLVLVLLLVGFANAQVKSITGKVVDVEYGNRWASIIVQVGNKKYFVEINNPKTVGKVDEVGRKVTVFYTRIESHSYTDGELMATKIVEVKKSKKK